MLVETGTLDLDRFAKIRRLHDSTTNAGEKAAAATRMKVIAETAGMTVEQVASKLDAAAPKPVHDAFVGSSFAKAWADLMNTPEQRAFEEKRAAEREKQRQEALREHGTQEALFGENPWERRLRESCQPLLGRHAVHGYTTLDGWDGVGSRIPAKVRIAVSSAYRLPRTVTEAWDETQFWEQLLDHRCAFERDYEPWHWIRARIQVVEELCDTLPSRGIEDLQRRVEWMRHVNNLGWSRDVHEDNALIDRLAADVASMAGVVTALAGMVERVSRQEMTSAAVQSGHEDHASQHPAADVRSGRPYRTNADKRRDVLALLGQGLTDREIARRAGVSPTTVGSIRNAQNGR
ncbi:helix-turn-helix transcriptional regulator [Methylobacterium tardum]|uniref:helix-turn-helix transcriptional regulator n=1 Tax=Methylobacterium tardum TaxID=374432 RepID=UPI00360A164C